MGHNKKTKSKSNRGRRRRRIADHIAENIFNKTIEENFPNLKNNIPMKVQEAYRTPNRLDQKKIPSPYNHQNTKHSD